MDTPNYCQSERRNNLRRKTDQSFGVAARRLGYGSQEELLEAIATGELVLLHSPLTLDDRMRAAENLQKIEYLIQASQSFTVSCKEAVEIHIIYAEIVIWRDIWAMHCRTTLINQATIPVHELYNIKELKMEWKPWRVTLQ
jgi:hypothetical protein